MSSSAQTPRKLPRGHHGLAPEEVEADQRERLISAITELVGEVGYRRASVARIIARAGVSRTTFYELFDDRADCFSAAHRRAVAQVDKALRSSQGLEALYELVRSRPGLAAVSFHACRVSGPGPERNFLRASRRWSERLGSHPRLQELLPPTDGLPTEIDLMMLGAVITVLTKEVAPEAKSGGGEGVDFDRLLSSALLPYLGPERAVNRFAGRNE